MTTRQETIVYGDFVAPVGTVVANIVLTITDSMGVQQSVTLPPGTQSATFELAPEMYVASAQAVDAGNAPIGPAATDTFTISAPATVVLQIPIALIGSDIVQVPVALTGV